MKIKETIAFSRSFWLLIKFSLSESLVLNIEQYGEYAYLC